MRPVSHSHLSANVRSATSFHVLPQFIRLFLAAACTLVFCAFPILAQSPAAGSNWDHVRALPIHTRLHVSADHMSHTCYLLSVDDTALMCGRYTFPRAEVKSVKLTRYGLSYGAGAGIGAGIGVGIGLGISAGTNDALFKNDKASYAGGGAAIGAVIGAVIVGPLDLFKGPTVYQRQ